MNTPTVVINLLRKHTAELKAEVSALIREGDLQRASEVKYGQLSELENFLEELQRSEVVHQSEHQMLFRDTNGRLWAATPVDDLAVDHMHDGQDSTRPGPWWMRVDEALDMNARRQLVLRQAEAALRDGEYKVASVIESRALGLIEDWIATHKTYEVKASTDERTVLLDDQGLLWLATLMPGGGLPPPASNVRS